MKLVGLALTLAGLAITAFVHPPTQVHTHPTTVVVQRNQTLWGICSKHDPQGMDVREYIDQVEQVNHLDDNGDIAAGQALKLP